LSDAPPAAATSSDTLNAFLAQSELPNDRARQALAVLGHYTGCSEGYLYLGGSALLLSAALDEHALPDALLAQLKLVAAAPENDTPLCTPLAPDYHAYRIPGGFAVLRTHNANTTQLPEKLLVDIGRSLRNAS
jgi:hypothetical protein